MTSKWSCILFTMKLCIEYIWIQMKTVLICLLFLIGAHCLALHQQIEKNTNMVVLKLRRQVDFCNLFFILKTFSQVRFLLNILNNYRKGWEHDILPTLEVNKSTNKKNYTMKSKEDLEAYKYYEKVILGNICFYIFLFFFTSNFIFRNKALRNF